MGFLKIYLQGVKILNVARYSARSERIYLKREETEFTVNTILCYIIFLWQLQHEYQNNYVMALASHKL